MENPPISGSLAMIRSAWHHVSGNGDPRAGELYQASLMSALMAGIYEGDQTYGEMRKHGDFGLGTFNDLDGEMIGFDGTFYQLRSDGSARVVSPEQKTPFAVVTFFQADQELEVTEPMSKSELEAAIEQATDANLFSAIRVDGVFDQMRTRTAQRQVRPFPPLTEAARHQSEITLNEVEGTLAGFLTPAYAQGIGVAGFHLHFLRKDKQAGGHALDYQLRSGKVQICTAHDLQLELPTSGDFVTKNFGDPALDEKIKAVE
jgi:acetolactate decarboxylase